VLCCQTASAYEDPGRFVLDKRERPDGVVIGHRGAYANRVSKISLLHRQVPHVGYPRERRQAGDCILRRCDGVVSRRNQTIQGIFEGDVCILQAEKPYNLDRVTGKDVGSLRRLNADPPRFIFDDHVVRVALHDSALDVDTVFERFFGGQSSKGHDGMER